MARGRRWTQKSRAQKPETVRKTLAITRLNNQAEGVAELDGKNIAIPFTLEGEEAIVDVAGRRGRLVDLTHRNARERRTPECPIYTKCGGCKMQHFSPEAYEHWKSQRVTQPFTSDDHTGDAAPQAVDPLTFVSENTRRRATFAARKVGGEVVLGFLEEKSHRIEPMDRCLLLTPALNAALPTLRGLADIVIVGKANVRLHVLDSETGLDVLITGVADVLSFEQERKLISLAGAHKIARLSVEEQVLIEYSAPLLTIGNAQVTPPPGGFTQSTASSEKVLADLVLAHLSGKKYVVDLFAGIGTFALRLADASRVHAVEGDAPAMATLEKAARAALGLKPVTVEKRDLFRRPLMAKELNKFDGIALDPPRAGAEAQVHEIAKSTVSTVAYVSCSPQSFHRDAKVLMEGGYILTRVSPVDQFLYAPHIELVGLFKRG